MISKWSAQSVEKNNRNKESNVFQSQKHIISGCFKVNSPPSLATGL